MQELNQKTAIVLGGTHDHITLLQILAQKGYRTVLVDYFENPPAKAYADHFVRESTLDKEKVLQISREMHANVVIATCIDQALLTMSFVCEELGLPCHINYNQALNLTNKAYMKKVFLENGIPSSPYVILEESDDPIAVQQTAKYPLVVKPADSNSSKGIRRVDNDSELTAAVADAFTFSRSKKVVVEGFVDGLELSVDVVIKNGDAHIIMVSQNLKNSNFTDSFTIVQNTFYKQLYEKYKDMLTVIATNIAKAFKISNGPMLIQLLAEGDSLSVIEFSSRIGGGSKHSFIRTIAGFDMLGYFVDLITGGDNPVDTSYPYRYGAMNYIYTRPGKIGKFEGFDHLKTQQIISDYFFYKTEGMEITNNISSADRPAGYMVVDDDLSRINQKIRQADAMLRVFDTDGSDMMNHGLHTGLVSFS